MTAPSVMRRRSPPRPARRCRSNGRWRGRDVSRRSGLAHDMLRPRRARESLRPRMHPATGAPAWPTGAIRVTLVWLRRDGRRPSETAAGIVERRRAVAIADGAAAEAAIAVIERA